MHGDRLRALREKSHLTQRDLSERLNISESQIFRYEKNEIEPRADVVVKIAEFFNVTTDYLLGLSDQMGVYTKSDLKPHERAVIDAWRRGDLRGALKVMVGDE